MPQSTDIAVIDEPYRLEQDFWMGSRWLADRALSTLHPADRALSTLHPAGPDVVRELESAHKGG